MILRFWLTLYTEKGKELRSPGLLLFFSFLFRLLKSASLEKWIAFICLGFYTFFFRSRLLSHFFCCSLPLLGSLLDLAECTSPGLATDLSISPARVFLFPLRGVCREWKEREPKRKMKDHRRTVEKIFFAIVFWLIRRTCSNRMEAADGASKSSQKKRKSKARGPGPARDRFSSPRRDRFFFFKWSFHYPSQSDAFQFTFHQHWIGRHFAENRQKSLRPSTFFRQEKNQMEREVRNRKPSTDRPRAESGLVCSSTRRHDRPEPPWLWKCFFTLICFLIADFGEVGLRLSRVEEARIDSISRLIEKKVWRCIKGDFFFANARQKRKASRRVDMPSGQRHMLERKPEGKAWRIASPKSPERND